MPAVNTVRLPLRSAREHLPFDVVFEDLDGETESNILVAATRLFQSAGEAECDIRGACMLRGNCVHVADVWLDGEERRAGSYRLRIIVANAGRSVTIECNLLAEVTEA